MEREARLIARIALYRRYLREGADGDVARAYLWQIKIDEAALAAIAEGNGNNEQRTGTADRSTSAILPLAGQGISKDG
jgi:hypothetical protein